MGVEEDITARDEFPLKRELEVIAYEIVAVLGYGVQGLGHILQNQSSFF